ncbi:MAG: winged helix-turn-helix transcriptional regulator [Clostridia bacterium]|nr:winged helix-turn-helix transcriptional regulator [Clostridia bacterium]
MQRPRYEKFILLIEGIEKSIRRMKLDRAPSLGIKSVHIFWLRHLAEHPEGISAAGLAEASKIDRSLVSREIEPLLCGGYITSGKDERHLVLTEEGRALAGEIDAMIVDVQKKVGAGIPEEELISFYQTLERLHDNFKTISEKKRKRAPRRTQREVCEGAD